MLTANEARGCLDRDDDGDREHDEGPDHRDLEDLAAAPLHVESPVVVPDNSRMLRHRSSARNGLGASRAPEGSVWFLPDRQDREPEEASWHTVVGGIDWGFNHPFACEIVQRSGSGRLATLDESYGRGHLVSELIPKLLELQERYKVDRFYADPSEPEYIAQSLRAGLRITGAVNDILPGIDAVSAAIAAGETVSPRCTGLLGDCPPTSGRATSRAILARSRSSRATTRATPGAMRTWAFSARARHPRVPPDGGSQGKGEG